MANRQRHLLPSDEDAINYLPPTLRSYQALLDLPPNVAIELTNRASLKSIQAKKEKDPEYQYSFPGVVTQKYQRPEQQPLRDRYINRKMAEIKEERQRNEPRVFGYTGVAPSDPRQEILFRLTEGDLRSGAGQFFNLKESRTGLFSGTIRDDWWNYYPEDVEVEDVWINRSKGQASQQARRVHHQ